MQAEWLIDLTRSLMPELCAYYIALSRNESLMAGNGARVGRCSLIRENLLWLFNRQRRAQRIIEQVCKKAGLSRRSPHDLRHTNAMIMLMGYHSPAYVQKQMGHHSILMIVNTYGRWIPGKGRQGLDKAFGIG